MIFTSDVVMGAASAATLMIAVSLQPLTIRADVTTSSGALARTE
jgi:hypothetical protein